MAGRANAFAVVILIHGCLHQFLAATRDEATARSQSLTADRHRVKDLFRALTRRLWSFASRPPQDVLSQASVRFGQPALAFTYFSAACSISG